VLQCIAVRCTLQCAAACEETLVFTLSMLLCVAVRWSALQRVAACDRKSAFALSILQYVAVHCSALHRVRESRRLRCQFYYSADHHCQRAF